MQNPFITKFKIKETDRFLVINCPEEHLRLISHDPHLPKPDTTIKKSRYSFIILFANDQNELEQSFSKIPNQSMIDINFWIAYPKEHTGGSSDLNRNKVRDILGDHDFRPVFQVAIDQKWSALRVKHKSQPSSKTYMEIPEIDLKNRKVFPPDDLLHSLESNNLLENFNKMSFTHQKEYVEAIVTAKKPETRQRRVKKTIEMINAKNK